MVDAIAELERSGSKWELVLIPLNDVGVAKTRHPFCFFDAEERPTDQVVVVCTKYKKSSCR